MLRAWRYRCGSICLGVAGSGIEGAGTGGSGWRGGDGPHPMDLGAPDAAPQQVGMIALLCCADAIILNDSAPVSTFSLCLLIQQFTGFVCFKAHRLPSLFAHAGRLSGGHAHAVTCSRPRRPGASSRGAGTAGRGVTIAGAAQRHQPEKPQVRRHVQCRLPLTCTRRLHTDAYRRAAMTHPH